MLGSPRTRRSCHTPSVRSEQPLPPTDTATAARQREGFLVDREKALDMALGQIEKQFGKGSIMKLGERGHVGIEAIPTGALALDLPPGIGGRPRGAGLGGPPAGALALDLALGIGGLPRGRIVEIFGPESSGKSTLATHVVAEAQRNGGTCAYIDAEHAMDPVYGRAIGMNVDELLISQ